MTNEELYGIISCRLNEIYLGCVRLNFDTLQITTISTLKKLFDYENYEWVSEFLIFENVLTHALKKIKSSIVVGAENVELRRNVINRCWNSYFFPNYWNKKLCTNQYNLFNIRDRQKVKGTFFVQCEEFYRLQ